MELLPSFSENYMPTSDLLISHLGLRTSICGQFRKGTQSHPWIWNLPIYSISPPNWWRNRETQSESRNLPPHLLWFSPWNMGRSHSHGGIHPQSLPPLHHRQIPILPHAGIQTTSHPQHHWNHSPPCIERTSQKPWHLMKRSTCHTQISTATREKPNQIQIWSQ